MPPIETPAAAKPKPRAIAWYRTHVDPKVLKSLHRRSDFLGAAQTLSYLGLLVLSGSAVLYAGAHWPVWAVIALIFLHGTFFSFQINAVHELGHGTVFQSKFLNALFVRVFAFLGWINFEMFNESHIRHHRYTLHAPDDLEVVLPLKVLVKNFFQSGFINLPWFVGTFRDTVRVACGRMKGEWELFLFPEGSPEKTAAVNWARTMLAGHGLIVLGSIYFHLWLLPVVTTFALIFGQWLFFLCNNTQHIGLQDDVSDFRLCSRSFTLNPFVQFLYWHMNYHIDHHMYAAVPCYRLGRLHRLIRHDLPPCPHGLVRTWLEIAAIQKKQKLDPSYQYAAPVPTA